MSCAQPAIAMHMLPQKILKAFPDHRILSRGIFSQVVQTMCKTDFLPSDFVCSERKEDLHDHTRENSQCGSRR
jgi:hypothetical protein